MDAYERHVMQEVITFILFFNPHGSLKGLIATLSNIYFIDMIYYIYDSLKFSFAEGIERINMITLGKKRCLATNWILRRE